MTLFWLVNNEIASVLHFLLLMLYLLVNGAFSSHTPTSGLQTMAPSRQGNTLSPSWWAALSLPADQWKVMKRINSCTRIAYTYSMSPHNLTWLCHESRFCPSWLIVTSLKSMAFFELSTIVFWYFNQNKNHLFFSFQDLSQLSHLAINSTKLYPLSVHSHFSLINYPTSPIQHHTFPSTHHYANTHLMIHSMSA